MTAPQTIDEYIATMREDVRPVLRAVRDAIRRAAPAAEERLSYRMPAFFLDGPLVYFAAFKAHVGLYPPVADAAVRKAVAKYAGPKGNLQFPLAEPMPLALITRVVKARLKDNRARARARAAR